MIFALLKNTQFRYSEILLVFYHKVGCGCSITLTNIGHKAVGAVFYGSMVFLLPITEVDTVKK